MEEEEKVEAKAFCVAIRKSLADLAANDVMAAAANKKVSNEHLLVQSRPVVRCQVVAMVSDNQLH